MIVITRVVVVDIVVVVVAVEKNPECFKLLMPATIFSQREASIKLFGVIQSQKNGLQS